MWQDLKTSLRNKHKAMRDSVPPFKKIHKAANRGMAHFEKSLPVLLRYGLILLFVWYSLELVLSTANEQAKVFLAILAGFVALTFLSVMLFTYWKYPWKDDEATPLEKASSLGPFLLINALMILLVAVLGKWKQHRGSDGFTSGLLGFTQFWVELLVHKIGALFTGRG